MPIVFTHDDQTIDLDDVPLHIYAEIEKTTEVPWWRLTAAPQLSADAGQLLAQKCAELVGVKLPNPLTPRVIVQLFQKVDEENRPTEYDDGIPDPKAKGSEPATT